MKIYTSIIKDHNGRIVEFLIKDTINDEYFNPIELEYLEESMTVIDYSSIDYLEEEDFIFLESCQINCNIIKNNNK